MQSIHDKKLCFRLKLRFLIALAAVLSTTSLLMTGCNLVVPELDTIAPANVTNLEVVAKNAEVVLIWTAPPDSDFVRVVITYTNGTAPVFVDKGTTTETITGLTNGTEYTFTVKTMDTTGNTSAGKIKTATPTDPVEVSNLQAAPETTQVTLTWTDPANPNIAMVEITFSPAAVDVPQPITVIPGTQTRTITGLTNGTEYTFTVKIMDTIGKTSPGKTKTAIPADTTAPAEVSNLEAASGNARVTLTWTDPADGDFANVEITFSPAAVGVTQPITVTPGTQTRAITGLTNGTEYTFTVKTVDTRGNKSSGKTITAILDAPFTGTELGLYIGAATSPQANTGTLALALDWLRENAANNTAYTILIGADESLAPFTLGGTSSGPSVAANGKTGVKVTLRGMGTERMVQLSSSGSLFTVNSGVTLVLNENITLVGISSNNTSLVRADGGNLEMWGNAKITGNTSSSYYSLPYSSTYGGGVSVSSGTFTMNDTASVSGNTASTFYSDGGGVYVSSGTFTMNDYASVSGNTARSPSSYSPYGGGVYVSSGTFTMNDNATVSGNTASAPSYAPYGGGVSVSSGTFTMNNNATVSGNTASSTSSSSKSGGGGGVYVSSSTFTMNDNAMVSGNTAGAAGGGVFASSGTFTMNGMTAVYGSADGIRANKVEGTTGTKLGVSLYDPYRIAKYGNGSYILPVGTTYTDATLTGPSIKND
ncbi:hypothetical protein FACS1894163_03830 [Spirochaetia bacterium]|nr:hypothetical protein FACS1894163_03830 [Spirochaetia bacterium]